MNNELYEAKMTLAHATWDWAKNYDGEAVSRALEVLIAAMGGKGWIESHPRYRNEPGQVLHAAGMRMDEVEDSLPATVTIFGTDLYFTRSDVRFLVSIPT